MPRQASALDSILEYKVDPWLKLIHLFRDCKGLEHAKKFNLMSVITAKDVDDMRELDDLVEQGYRPCYNCYKREEHYARRDNRRRRPGFIKEPRK